VCSFKKAHVTMAVFISTLRLLRLNLHVATARGREYPRPCYAIPTSCNSFLVFAFLPLLVAGGSADISGAVLRRVRECIEGFVVNTLPQAGAAG
jgi:hypothetical protein